ncbi:hypothetical protein Ahy_A05g021694 isoform A [Arachis hypogaea]|uniref:Uncharacterized protein n=1 Tax=Arachis hypogaea TaxID=3818 RepID=A0A445CY19_ARAHY|nr:hypothetical protein Ahy_A05g021694 isoform A [Arachis hypogaea]
MARRARHAIRIRNCLLLLLLPDLAVDLDLPPINVDIISPLALTLTRRSCSYLILTSIHFPSFLQKYSLNTPILTASPLNPSFSTASAKTAAVRRSQALPSSSSRPCFFLLQESQLLLPRPRRVSSWIIEHFALGRRRLELFGEDHNIRSGWLTVGKELSSSNFNKEWCTVKAKFKNGGSGAELWFACMV